MRRLRLTRLATDDRSTLGVLHLEDYDATGIRLSRRMLCWTLEDTKRGVKVPGETRIPAGTYRVGLRTDGPTAQKYAAAYPGHIGMLHVLDVPEFTFIYFHTGVTVQDTQGCVLVGNDCTKGLHEWVLADSRACYKRIYPELAAAAKKGQLTVSIEDFA